MPSFANKDDREDKPLTEAADPVAAGAVVSPPAAGPGRWALFAAIALCGAIIDLLTKRWAFNRLGSPEDGTKLWVWEPYFGFQLSLNEGALFGMGQGKVWLFAAVSMLAAAWIVYYLFWCGGARDLWLCIALALVMGGIAGNLYDRLGFGYRPPSGGRRFAVRDWILFQYGEYHWPNFNVADMMLVCGAIMLLIQALFPKRFSGAEVDIAS